MVSIETFREMALSLPDAIEAPHFEKTSFRVSKIFATLDIEKELACLMLSPIDQSVFTAFDSSVVYPVPNKWGIQGATFFELRTVKKSMLKDALFQAYAKATLKKPTKKQASSKKSRSTT